MRIISIVAAAAMLASPVFAQQAQRSSNPEGVQIKGNTDIKAKNTNTTAMAIGDNTHAAITTGVIKGGTTIKGNTTIKAQQTNSTAMAIGKNTSAVNEAGVIGGK